jgi:hypothetical protein
VDSAPQLQLTFEPLVVVEVSESFSHGLTGRTDRTYRSPPQLREHGLALAALLLDAPILPPGDGPWQRALAGGRRTVAVVEVDDPRR